jgi:hypothetical protein
MVDAVEDDPPPPASIDPDSIPGRLTMIEERLKAMSIELDSLRAGGVRRRRRTDTKRLETVVKISLTAVLLLILAQFLLYAMLAPSPAVVSPAAPRNAPELDLQF